MGIAVWFIIGLYLNGQVTGRRQRVLYPYGRNKGDTVKVPRDDENVKVQVDVPINYLNNSFDALWISANGVLDMSEQCYNWPYHRTRLCVNMMAAYWADNDFSRGGKLYYRTSTDQKLLRKTKRILKRKFCAPGFNPTQLLIVTWDEVDAYEGNIKYEGAEYTYCEEREGPGSMYFCNCQSQYHYEKDGATYCTCLLNYRDRRVCGCLALLEEHGEGYHSYCDCVVAYENPDYCGCLYDDGFTDCSCFLNSSERCPCRLQVGYDDPNCQCLLETGNREFCSCQGWEKYSQYSERACQCFIDSEALSHPYCQCAGCECEESPFEFRCSCPHKNDDECTCLLDGAADPQYCRCLVNNNGNSDYCKCLDRGDWACFCLNPTLATCKCYTNNMSNPVMCQCLIETEGDQEYCDCFAVHENDLYCECVSRFGEEGCECFLEKTRCLNTYQAVVATDGSSTYVLYNYGFIGWTTAESHRDNWHAVIGFTSERDDYMIYHHDLSGTADVENVMYSSNVEQNGRWAYKVDSYMQEPGSC